MRRPLPRFVLPSISSQHLWLPFWGIYYWLRIWNSGMDGNCDWGVRNPYRVDRPFFFPECLINIWYSAMLDLVGGCFRREGNSKDWSEFENERFLCQFISVEVLFANTRIIAIRLNHLQLKIGIYFSGRSDDPACWARTLCFRHWLAWACSGFSVTSYSSTRIESKTNSYLWSWNPSTK